MFERIKDSFIDVLIYTTTVAAVFLASAWIVMLIAQPLIAFSYIQSLSAVVLTFMFFFIGKLEFDNGGEDY